jgi:hypothetical protein
MLPNNHVDGPIGADQHQPIQSAPLCQRAHEIQCGIVAPVHVLHQQYEGLFRRQDFERLGHFPQRALS